MDKEEQLNNRIQLMADRMENLERALVASNDFNCTFCPAGNTCNHVKCQCVIKIRNACQEGAERQLEEGNHTSDSQYYVDWAKKTVKDLDEGEDND